MNCLRLGSWLFCVVVDLRSAINDFPFPFVVSLSNHERFVDPSTNALPPCYSSRMIIATILSLLLAGAPAQSAAPDSQQQCGTGLNIQLANGRPAKASNVALAKFEETSPDDPCVRNIKPDEYIRLHQRIVPLATKAFANSQASYGVMVRYTLTADKPAVVNMQVANAPPSEKDRLDPFYKQVTALTDFHSTSGTVYLAFQFNITPQLAPAQPRKHAKAS